MRGNRDYLDGLIDLPTVSDHTERRTLWRQSIATLAAQVADQRRAVPLDGYDPKALLRSARAAIHTGLIDDLDWISAPAGYAALYELAAALPSSDEKREIGRRVLRMLRVGNAPTFVAIATRLALGARRALNGVAIEARVALSLDLPIGSGAPADELALALISRRDSSRQWLTVPSMGALPSRRMAARLLERAAREAAARAMEGDDSGVRVFGTDVVQVAWQRLLQDRESLVWRHVASARGLLSAHDDSMHAEIKRHLHPEKGITEWRRAAASLGASIALRPDEAMAHARGLLKADLLKRDAGITAAMIFGLPRAIEARVPGVEELLEELVRRGGIPAAEALVELRRERLGMDKMHDAEFGAWAARRATALLREMSNSKDEGEVALGKLLADDLDKEQRDTRRHTLRSMIESAMEAFVTVGAEEAYSVALTVLESADSRMNFLEQCDENDRAGRLSAFRALHELDIAFLETDALVNLLSLGAKREELYQSTHQLGDAFQRLTNWLIIKEGDPPQDAQGGVLNPFLRQRRIRTLLHLVDADGAHFESRPELLRQRRVLTARVLFNRVSREPLQSALRRALCAATARCCDALIREEIAEVSDVVITAGAHVRSSEDIVTMAEASMVPDLEVSLFGYAKLHAETIEQRRSERMVQKSLKALANLANELPVACSPRVEALRRELVELHHALQDIYLSTSLSELVDPNLESPLLSFENASQSLAELSFGARRRLGDLTTDASPSVGPALRLVHLAVGRALKGSREMLSEALRSAKETLSQELPAAIAAVAISVLTRTETLPVRAPRRSRTPSIGVTIKEAPLPAWVPPGRTLGGFYISRTIGTGAVGSVFVAKRSDERSDPRSENFALKVPDYSGGAASTLSEDEFLRMFREEAGALLALPDHANIARFVTFDAGVRPKPILVMELVEGPNLESMLELGDLDITQGLRLLDGIAAGLQAMHEVGVGHLDVKPSNIIITADSNHTAGSNPERPVLVDFGLAGRKIRPGCGTAEYGAPEIWGLINEVAEPSAADVYAFGALAFEVLTGRVLFDGASPIAAITAHASHDGMPTAVGHLTSDPRTANLAELLRSCLRRNPSDRTTVTQIRQKLGRIEQDLEGVTWPLGGNKTVDMW